MRKLALGVFLILLISVPLFLMSVTAQDSSSGDEAEMTEEELVEYGEYLIHIYGCISCHTPYKAEFADFTQLTPEQLQTLSLTGLEAQDTEERRLAGGRPFDLGPFGVIWSANLTPDEETGIGGWTDEEIKIAIRIGRNPSGRQLFPLMPYANFFHMAEDDLNAVVAYLRSLPAVENEVDRSGPSGDGIAPVLTLDEEVPQSRPDGSEPAELGEYLVSMMSCGDCHTPLDPETFAPQMDMALAGGQAYEGPWGIVYGGNITPHDETGIGTWEAEDIERVLREGVRIDGRRLVLMPWEDYAVITDDDLEALVAFLQSMPAIENEVPAPSIEDLFIQFVDD